MDDKCAVIACYKAMYEGEIRKDIEMLKEHLADSYILVHMTGTKMNRQEYFDAILDGTLNYYSARHEHMSVSVNGNTANMTGDTCVEAAVYGGSRRFWSLRLKCEFIKENDVWKMTRSVASQY